MIVQGIFLSYKSRDAEPLGQRGHCAVLPVRRCASKRNDSVNGAEVVPGVNEGRGFLHLQISFQTPLAAVYGR